MSVSDKNNVNFAIGDTIYSVLAFNASVNTISRTGGTIDTRVSAAVVQLHADVDSRINTAMTQTSTTVMTVLASQMSVAVATGSADATAKTNQLILSASADASTQSVQLLVAADANTQSGISTMKSSITDQFQTFDAAALNGAKSVTNAAQSALSTQLSCKSFASLTILLGRV